MTQTWPRAALSERDLAAIRQTHWRRFPAETVIAIAEAWNAGHRTRPMAHDLKCRPGSLRLLIGRLSQRGVRMRLAEEQPFPPEPQAHHDGVERASLVLQIGRLNRLAAFDPMLVQASRRAQRELRRFG